MKSAFTHWANLEAARDDSSMNLNYDQNLPNKIIFFLQNGAFQDDIYDCIYNEILLFILE